MVTDIFYVDYCNNCKDLEIMDSKEVPCHHPYYCWQDKGECQEMEYQLAILYEKERVNGYLSAYEKELLYKLKGKKFELVKEKVREWRRSVRK